MIIVPAFYKRYFKCIATKEQMHFCEEMKDYSEGNCALILAGLVGPPWVQWSKEIVSQARENKVLCTNAGILYDEGATPPADQPLKEELDCSQEELDSLVFRAADRPVATQPYGDGDMRFEYVDVHPGNAGGWNADRERNYCAWLLEGPELAVQAQDAERIGKALMRMEVLVVPKGQSWGLSLPESAGSSALVFLISGSITEESYSPEVLGQVEKAAKRARTDLA